MDRRIAFWLWVGSCPCAGEGNPRLSRPAPERPNFLLLRLRPLTEAHAIEYNNCDRARRVPPFCRFEDTVQGVVCDVNPSLRDEAPDAYKDLDTVMENQESLIEVVHRLLPVVNVKGF